MAIEKILWLANVEPKKFGSFERSCIAFARQCSENNIEFTIVFRMNPIRGLRAELEQHHARILTTDNLLPTFRNYRVWLKIASTISDFRPDIVHTHFYPIFGLASIISRMFGAKCYMHYRISGEKADTNKLKEYLKRLRSLLVGWTIERVLCISEYNKSVFLHNFQANEKLVTVIYNAVVVPNVNIENKKRLSSAGLRVIVVGTLSRVKGIHDLIAALPIFVQKSKTPISLEVVGEGDYKASLEVLAATVRSQLVEVNFLGLRQDVPELLYKADVSVVPSIWGEAFGNTIAETMAASCPLVVTDVGASREITCDGRGALIAKPNDPESLGEKLVNIFEDKAAARERVNFAFDCAKEKYNSEDWAGVVLGLYEQE